MTYESTKLRFINIVVHIILLSKTPDKSRSSSVEVINVINLIKFS